MKRVKLCLIVFFVLIVCIVGVNAEVEFNIGDSETWYNYPEMMGSIPIASLVDNVEDSKTLFEYLDEKQRSGFNEALLKEKVKGIVSSGLGDVGLSWDGDKLIGKNGAVLDLENLPENLIGILYDNENGFTYKIKRGSSDVSSLGVDKGGYGEKGFYGTDSILDDVEANMNGEVVLKNGIVSLDKGASINIGKIDYSQSSEDKKGFVKILSESRAVLTNAKAEYSGIGSVKAYDNPSLSVFDSENVEEKYSKQYARFSVEGDISKIDFYGENKMDVVLDRKYNEVKGVGLENSEVSVLDGNVRIEFNGDMTKYPRDVRNAEFTIDNIVNELDSENVFGLQKYKYEHKVEVSDIEGIEPSVSTVMIATDSASGLNDAGSFLINLNKGVVVGVGALESDFHGIPVKVARYSLGFEDGYLDSLPEGINSREEFISAFEKKGKQMSIQLLASTSPDGISEILQNSQGGVLEKIKERYVGKSNMEKAFEFFRQVGEFGSPSFDENSAGAFVGEFPEESFDLANLVGDMSYNIDSGKLGYFDARTTIIFDSRREPGIVSVSGVRKGFNQEPLLIQRIYPQEFVDKLIDDFAGRTGAMDKDWEKYKSKN